NKTAAHIRVECLRLNIQDGECLTALDVVIRRAGYARHPCGCGHGLPPHNAFFVTLGSQSGFAKIAPDDAEPQAAERRSGKASIAAYKIVLANAPPASESRAKARCRPGTIARRLAAARHQAECCAVKTRCRRPAI